jgi:ATP-binding protein involved in chromosome partitioning
VSAERRHTPAEIGPDASGERLRILWQDEVESVYAPRDLRLACPCAACVDEMTGRRLLTPDAVAGNVYPLEIQYVGRYAIQFIWSDGHRTGIYPFEYLRRLAERP